VRSRCCVALRCRDQVFWSNWAILSSCARFAVVRALGGGVELQRSSFGEFLDNSLVLVLNSLVSESEESSLSCRDQTL
jgi:hypothetical protein